MTVDASEHPPPSPGFTPLLLVPPLELVAPELLAPPLLVTRSTSHRCRRPSHCPM